MEPVSLSYGNTDIIEILASEYTSVFYVDLENDTLIPYSSNTFSLLPTLLSP